MAHAGTRGSLPSGALCTSTRTPFHPPQPQNCPSPSNEQQRALCLPSLRADARLSSHGSHGSQRGCAQRQSHHYARRQRGPLPVVVTVGELQVEEQSAVCSRIQAVSVHQHLQAKAAAPVEPRRVHHAYGRESRDL